jgi:hypothetical protein
MENTTITLIIVSVITVGSLVGVFIKMVGGFGPINLKVYGLTLVVGLGVILALSDIESQKATVCFSLLSAVAGYLFGLKNENSGPKH